MNEIVQYSQHLGIEELQRTAKLLAASGYFETAKDGTVAMAQLATKIMAGQEMGFGPFASANGIYIIQGKPSVSANLMASAVKAHPHYDYRIRKMEDAIVAIEFFQDGESLGVSTFTANDAKKAGTKNMAKFPRNMLFARAMSNGIRWYCPDVFNGNAVYTPDEVQPRITARVIDESTGEIIESDDVDFTMDDVEEIEVAAPASAPNPFDEQASAPATLRDNEKLRKHFHAVGTELYGADWNDKRYELVKAIAPDATSSNELTIEQAHTLIDGMRKRLNA